MAIVPAAGALAFFGFACQETNNFSWLIILKTNWKEARMAKIILQ